MVPHSGFSAELPTYHERLVIIQTGPYVPSAALSIDGRIQTGPPSFAPLIARGVVRRIMPISAGAAAAAFSAEFVGGGVEAPALQGNPLSGFSVVELGEEYEATAIAGELERTGDVISASPVPLRHLLLPQFLSPAWSTPPTEARTHKLWHHERIELAAARADPRYPAGSPVRVGVLDTGVDRDHPDLRDRVRSYSYGMGLAAGDATDIQGHGTHVAGTIAGSAVEPGEEIGICECELHVWKVFSDQARHFPELGLCLYVVDPVAYRAALAQCLDQGIDVINLSLGGGAPLDPMESLIFGSLLQAGATVVAAMGNLGSLSPMYPAVHPGVIAVGATDHHDAVAPFSNRGNHLALCAPGVDIWSSLPTYPGHRALKGVPAAVGQPPCGAPLARPTHYADMNGTSMACAQVAGAVATLLATGFERSATAVRERLALTADRIADVNQSLDQTAYGAGRLNLRRLLWE